MMKYADYTRNTSEPLKRIAHGRRFEQAFKLVSPLATDKILDYGCGDAHLFSHFLGRFSRDGLVGYDPNPKLLAEASPEVAGESTLTSDIETLKLQYPFAFSLIYCMEVCEHLTDKALDQLFSNIKVMASPHAQIVFGIPIETGLSGFIKSLYRMARGGRQNASIPNALKSFFGIKIVRHATDVEWYGHHTGFNHQRLKEQLESAGFKVRRSHYLPFPMFGTILNNEIYYICSIK